VIGSKITVELYPLVCSGINVTTLLRPLLEFRAGCGNLVWSITCIMHPSVELPEFTSHEVGVEVGDSEVVDCD